MKATLNKNIVVWGADIEGQRYTPINDSGRIAQESFKKVEIKFDRKYRDYARRFSLPVQEVDVIEIFDQAKHAEQYATPTWSEIVLRVRGINFDGEAIDTVISLSDLEGMPKQDVLARIAQASTDWQKIKNLFGQE